MRDDDFFWEGARNGKLLFKKCGDCGSLCHPPGPMCPTCQSLNWTHHESRGRGTVYTWLVSKHPSKPDAAPRTVVLVEMEDGVRLVSNLQGIDAADVRQGLAVEVFFQQVGEHVLPQFRPVQP